MGPKNHTSELRQLIKDARWAMWAFATINILVLVVLVIDGMNNMFVFMAVFLQVFLFLIWLLPVFLYQVLIKKLSLKYALYTSFASYKEALGHLSW